MPEGIGIGYSVLEKTDSTVRISCLDSNNVKQVVTIPLTTWDVAKLAIDAGVDAWQILNAFVQTKASSAKAISAEAAEKAELAAKVNSAITAFNVALSEHVWSNAIDAIVVDYQVARQDVEDAKGQGMPVLDLNVLRRLQGRLAVNDASVWSYVSKGSGESEFWYYMVKADPPADHSATVALREARAAFQIACHDETLSLADPILASELKVTSFTLNGEGEITYDAKVKVARASGNGTRTRGPWLYQGTDFPAASGQVFQTVASFAIAVGLSNPDDPYPHAAGKKFRENGSLTKVES